MKRDALETLLLVAEKLDDKNPVKYRILNVHARAMLAVSDGISDAPVGAPPMDSEEDKKTPVEQLTDIEPEILDLYELKTEEDPDVKAAVSLPLAFATIDRYLEEILMGIPESDNKEISESMGEYKDSIAAVKELVATGSAWATKLSDLVTMPLPETVPQFPSNPQHLPELTTPEEEEPTEEEPAEEPEVEEEEEEATEPETFDDLLGT